MHDFADFQSAKFHTRRGSVTWWILSQ